MPTVGVTSGNWHCRMQPDPEAAVVTYAYDGDVLEIASTDPVTGWKLVKIASIQCWIHPDAFAVIDTGDK